MKQTESRNTELSKCYFDHSPDDTSAERISSPNNRLLARGWSQRFMVGLDRKEEVVDLYESLGFDVIAEEIDPEDMSQECQDCQLLICREFVMIYTRKK